MRVLFLSKAKAIRRVFPGCGKVLLESRRQDGTAAIWRAVCDCSLDLVLIKMGEMARDVASKEGSACQD